jgi:hypothetical protein
MMGSSDMRTISGLALALLIAAAGACRSRDAAKPRPKGDSSAKDDETSENAGSNERRAGRPALPNLRRMRGSEPSSAEEQGDSARQEGQSKQWEEWEAWEALQARHDTNGDGALDDQERDEMKNNRVKAMVSLIDSDADGTISRDEAQSAPTRTGAYSRLARVFDELDTNGDSLLTEEELAASRMRPGPRMRDGDRGGAIEEPAAEAGTAP